MRTARFDEANPSDPQDHGPRRGATKEQRQAFDCGEQSLNDWLVRQAGQSMKRGDAVTTLLLDDDANPGGDAVIAGYYCLSAGEVGRGDVPAHLAKGAPTQIPVVRMGRLAVDRRYRERGERLGAELLRHAMRAAAESDVGGRLLAVDALHDQALEFYLHMGFLRSPIHPLQAVFDLRRVPAREADPMPKPHAMSPTSFDDAKVVADKFKAGVPVILNLRGTDPDLSRRLIDFAAGLCYGLCGQMERVASDVYLCSPSER